MRQWLERIQQFLPDAKVGKIQANVIDIDDKDIVIGMIQSLSQKTYDIKAFESFGLSVYDECMYIYMHACRYVCMRVYICAHVSLCVR